jgi:hypothetical protein
LKGKANYTFSFEGLGGSQSILVNSISVNSIGINIPISLQA